MRNPQVTIVSILKLTKSWSFMIWMICVLYPPCFLHFIATPSRVDAEKLQAAFNMYVYIYIHNSERFYLFLVVAMARFNHSQHVMLNCQSAKIWLKL